jgi:transcriptional regulator GlxA family with amidase domain
VLPLETLARVACMSTYHFVRYFALLHGATPHAYLVGCRAAVARRMLADGITDHRLIAERSGFSPAIEPVSRARRRSKTGPGGAASHRPAGVGARRASS